MKIVHFLTLGLCLAANACVPKENGAPAKVMTLGEIPVTRALGSGVATLPTATPQDWALGDPQLASLIERGLAGSPHLAQVDARVRKATAYLAFMKARRSPALDANARMTVGKVSTEHGFDTALIPSGFIPDGVHSNSQVSLDLNWDLDLWGKNRAALAAATSEAEAARFDALEAQQLLVRGIALTYVEYAQAHTDAALAELAAGSYDEAARLVRARINAGLDNELAATRADSAKALALGEQIEAREALALAQFRLAALVGEGPDFGLSLVAPMIVVVDRPFEGIGIDSLANRPDVAAAKARIEARYQDVIVAEKEFYPNISLSALLGFQALDVGRLFTGAAAIPSVGPAIHLPIINGGRMKAKLNEARADRDGSIAAYNETLLNALRDAASALRRTRDAQAIYTQYQVASRAADTARQHADRRLSAQLVNKLAVLDARIASTQAKRREQIAANRIATAQIELMAALGGHSFKSSGD